MRCEGAVLERDAKTGQITGSKALTTKQQIFIERVASGMNPTAAATAAGYRHPHVDAARLKRLPHIRQRMFEIRQRRLEQGAGLATRTIVEIMQDDAAPHAVRLQAAKALLDYAGHGQAGKADPAADAAQDVRNLTLAELEALWRQRIDNTKIIGVSPTIDQSHIVPSGAMRGDPMPEIIDISLPNEGSVTPVEGEVEPLDAAGQADLTDP